MLGGASRTAASGRGWPESDGGDQVCTRNAAEVLGDLKNRGTLEPGKRADFLILDADPLADIRNTTRLASVYHGGKRIQPMFQEEFGPRTSPTP